MLRHLQAIEPKRQAHFKISPTTGPFEDNVHAKAWHLRAPNGVAYQFRNLHQFIRTNTNLFDAEDVQWKLTDDRSTALCCNAAKGLGRLRPDRKTPVGSWKGWNWAGLQPRGGNDANSGILRVAANPGFTLIELLVVMAIIIIVVSTATPALTRAKSSARGLQCLNNLRQMGLSWQMYAHDNDDKVPPNSVENSSPAKTWVQGWIDLNNRTDNTNTVYLQHSHLWPYLGSLAIWKCPEDKSISVHGGKAYPRVRSYSMNSYLNAGCNPPPPNIIFKLTEMVEPPPAKTMVLIDERDASINDGVFSVDMEESRINDWPGVYHHGASALNFADGHVALKKWRDPRTAPNIPKGQPLFTGGSPSPGNEDVVYLQERTTSRLK